MKISLNLVKKINYSFLLMFFLFLPFNSLVAAEENDLDSIEIDEPVYENIIFQADQNINLSGQMKDDVYLAGTNVLVSGVVEGDIMATGAYVVIDAEVKGDVRVAGATVVIKGKIDNNLTVFAADLTIEESAEIGKNIVFGAGNVRLNGKVNKNLYGGGGNIILNNEISGNVYLGIDPEGTLLLLPQANIYGNLEYTARETAELQPGAQVQQQEKFSQLMVKDQTKFFSKNILKSIYWLVWFVMLLGTLLVGLLIIALFKDFTLKAVKSSEKNVLMHILKGLVFLIVTPFAIFILAMTIIGIPLALIATAIYLIILYISKIFIAVYLGNKVIKLFNKQVKEIQLAWSMILGLVILYILFAIPFLGMLIKLIICLWGVGILLTLAKKQFKLDKK
ncbi:MAG: hypothetical protein GF365_01130|nr:hypothetical protein [Candidatus Buchananbacteria bacterium]